MIVSVNPATGAELARFTPLTGDEVESAVDAAVSAQRQWRKRPLAERAAMLRDLAAVLRDRKDRYARLIVGEMGKPLVEAEAEIEKCAVTCEHYARHAAGYLADRSVTAGASVGYDPLGVVLAVMPWNYPFWQFFRFAAPAFAAGNGALLKHANNVPQCALAVEEVVRDAGFPANLFRTLLVGVEQIAPLIADDRIAAVTLTGSTEVGAIVAAQAGAALKKQVLELGGSDPFLVLADADVEAAARAAVPARFLNGGQSCVNAKRFIVEDAVADEFVAAFLRHTAELKVGDPADPATAIGPMARANLRDTLHDQVRRSVAAGAEVLLGGEPVDGPGFFYPPTILDHVRPGMAAFDEETFGPLAAITRVPGTATAVDLANRTDFGLGASVWTSDVDLAREIEAGAVFVNAVVASDPRLPFGGIKKSGYGRELGAEGIREFCNTKTLWIGARP
ncbi:NAD-dependent succinate-semialdehyde dehydrogenase [Amycolatopsis sp. OK19-0408]|uniref:NAD-dependent succinate-semialdehyde dehydrogenase n=1 Tax=Amycolatopsis iheyensis TaxID=2945988 RepID=A0A9X2NDL4_9PSEU|nr:NAD-dependent succinate-semialdehyde dehydrogenase [Amycolatopsis iheyensis]MCR6485027.1 NAD-dependent succinate-semialdehyde dehydrogenase [Amycolatopsis iheyensis]